MTVGGEGGGEGFNPVVRWEEQRPLDPWGREGGQPDTPVGVGGQEQSAASERGEEGGHLRERRREEQGGRGGGRTSEGGEEGGAVKEGRRRGDLAALVRDVGDQIFGGDAEAFGREAGAQQHVPQQLHRTRVPLRLRLDREDCRLCAMEDVRWGRGSRLKEDVSWGWEKAPFK